MNCRAIIVAGTLELLCRIAPAHADPCEAPLPSQAGVRFSGVVRYVGDGDGLCVGRTVDPKEWIEVRLADFNAPELHQPGGVTAKAALERIALHHAVVCTTERGRGGRVVSYDRVLARCQIGADSIGELLRHAGVAEGGN
ncbi:nuclease [Mesorhizobium sp. M5C.F.Ca.IN.020.32.2.1]|uniref:thermonuclease family protein n=1 Tax=Mesorhizobium sp. M5C.F.Ca.IN.020.32.2.1 TaxID=2496771 RepID=UPI000FD40CB9|nr:nuclease [Mesorhizobium sp. M5C.F.Ca.IN.020.32.2.1]RUV29187.1 nuclease [Mesorhizobium sp. M5C.F.Ca.IN.020.32.2.1]